MTHNLSVFAQRADTSPRDDGAQRSQNIAISPSVAAPSALPASLRPATQFFAHDGGAAEQAKALFAGLDPQKTHVVVGGGIAGNALALLIARHPKTMEQGRGVLLLADRAKAHLNPITMKRESHDVYRALFPGLMEDFAARHVTTPMRFNGMETTLGALEITPIPQQDHVPYRMGNLRNAKSVNAVSFSNHSFVAGLNEACRTEPNITILTARATLDENPAAPGEKRLLHLRAPDGGVLFDMRHYTKLWLTDGASSKNRDVLTSYREPKLPQANTFTIQPATGWRYDVYEGRPLHKGGAHCFKIAADECYTVITAEEAHRALLYIAVSLPESVLSDQTAEGRETAYRAAHQRLTDLVLRHEFSVPYQFRKLEDLSGRYVSDRHRIAAIASRDDIILAGDAAANGPPILGLSMNAFAEQLLLADKLLNQEDNSPAGRSAAEQMIAHTHAQVVQYRNGRVFQTLRSAGFYSAQDETQFQQAEAALGTDGRAAKGVVE